MDAQRNIIKASAFAIFAFFAMAVFGILTNQGYKHGDPFWVSFITYTAGTLTTALFILPLGMKELKSEHYPLLIARAIIGTAASFFYMLSMAYIPIINSTLLFNTAPIFIPLLTLLVLKMPIKKSIWRAVILGFIGIIAIIKPKEDTLTDPGNLIGLAAGLSLAIAYMIMKTLTDTDSGLRIIFYYLGIGTLIQIPLLFFAGPIPTQATFLYAALSGIVLFIAQFGLVKAYKYADASEVGVYQYSSVVFVGMMEWIIWGHTPGALFFVGFLLVSIAGIFIIRANGKEVKPAV